MKDIFVIPERRHNLLSYFLLLSGLILMVAVSVLGPSLLVWPGSILMVLGLRRFFEPQDLHQKNSVQVMSYGFKIGILFGAAIAIREALAGHNVAWAVPLAIIAMVLVGVRLTKRPSGRAQTTD